MARNTDNPVGQLLRIGDVDEAHALVLKAYKKHNWDRHAVAAEFEVSPVTVSAWLYRYPSLKEAVTEGRKAWIRKRAGLK